MSHIAQIIIRFHQICTVKHYMLTYNYHYYYYRYHYHYQPNYYYDLWLCLTSYFSDHARSWRRISVNILFAPPLIF